SGRGGGVGQTARSTHSKKKNGLQPLNPQEVARFGGCAQKNNPTYLNQIFIKKKTNTTTQKKL
ncbi:hypothetical protein, partial [Enterobacter hormaechei]